VGKVRRVEVADHEVVRVSVCGSSGDREVRLRDREWLWRKGREGLSNNNLTHLPRPHSLLGREKER
jgi:hypothetical protein